MKRCALQTVAAGLLAVTLAGCANKTPPAVLLTLPAAAPASPAPAAGTSAKVLVVRRTEIPEYLQTRHVRYRAQSSTLEAWPGVLWAERLEVGVTRELAAALRDALPGWTICEASCAEAQPEISLSLHLRPLDFSRSRRELEAEARWSVSQLQPSPRVMASGRQRETVAAASDTPEAHAQSITQLLQALARTVADRVRAMP
ncbi:PqiC family protein [Schlegelella sp. S2-27]|uniref:PqiC family protein n=1 Tax=Caldimonas mangrovi TaxID=2944811 RepID=A0ABT0YM36_9BURK|nr:ABC-type transport auxiliary lipoprotein family protein [Caldimonas mangrovi]MCM5679216.1 PqiC family protein [Caldimonas mangrovi]